MKHSFIIAAHTDPKLLKTIIEQLDGDNHHFFCHIDKRSKEMIASDECEELKKKKNVTIISRYRLNWGGVSQIKTTICLLRLALEEKTDWIHFISGQDFPIHSNEYFDEFFLETKYKGFFSFSDKSKLPVIEAFRLNRYHLNDIINKKGRNSIAIFISRVLDKIQQFLIKLGIKVRKPLGLRIQKGSCWFNIHSSIAVFILKYIDKHPKYLKRFNYTSCGDEVFFHTILLQSPFLDEICHDDLRYIKWPKNASSPSWLTMEDYDNIIHSNKLFCRKVNVEYSDELLKMLKAFISSESTLFNKGTHT